MHLLKTHIIFLCFLSTQHDVYDIQVLEQQMKDRIL